ncbi:MAG TPA: sialidase family protein [Candidatus Limnocylindria bacterium]|jgi:hypothetical protein|nr:sialidase family protein [Candidatus Limnocylindria bacterium]
MTTKLIFTTAALVLALATSPAITSYATSSTNAQANQPQVAGDPTSGTTARFPTNKQNEPSIAVDPTDSLKLIAGSNDEQRQPPCGPGPVRGSAAPNDCSFFPNVGSDGVYTSSDGGVTWTNRGLLPGFTDSNPSNALVSDGDPVIVFGPKPSGSEFSFDTGARAYYAGLASFATGAAKGQQVPELLTVSTSDDDGATWSAPVIAARGNGFKFNDKEDIWADRNPSSPFFGSVYISWTQFRGSIFTFFAEPVMVSFSRDGGRTWSRPNQLSIAQNFAFGGRQGSVVRTGPNGEVYVIWEDSDRGGAKQVIARSVDGGVSWTHPMDISHFKDIADPIPGANFRTDSFASAAVDQSNGAIYVAWSAAISSSGASSGRIVMSKSTNQGSTWSTAIPVSAAADGYAFFQGLDVAPTGRVDVGYQALKATSTATYGAGNATIDAFFVSSPDGGATWSGSTKITSTSSDPAASAQNNLERQFWGDYNTLVSTTSAVYFIYTDARNGAACAPVDAYQHGVDGSGAAAPKPAPQSVCPAQFGNTDIFVSKVSP